ncbi:MAG TPA: DUF6644 family protein [Steroidobacteraceae bacterium]|nr:DUF6644 family protein [Steroidobacteraceae bacterium]
MDAATLNSLHVPITEFGVNSGIHAFMNSAWAWPAMESLHFLGLSLLMGTVGIFDLRMLGLARSISMAALHKLVPWGVAGYCVNVSSGFLFFVSDPTQYLYNPAFQLKVLCMFIAGVNMVVFYLTTAKQIKASDAGDFAPLNARIIAAISLAAWSSVIVFGRLITFHRPPDHWCFWCT